MAKLIGTAGHVDHGKTSLIAALTGIDADRLPEEKARGMSIDIGFAYIDLPGIGRTSIVDVPGHERFLTNMLAGAHAVDVALLCVAADESVKPQTRQHLQVLQMLGTQAIVVALTKADLAASDRRAATRTAVAELLAASGFQPSPIFDVSSATGEGLDALREALAEALKQVGDDEQGLGWYLPVDRAFTAKGHGAIVTGTVARGAVAPGAEGILQPEGIAVRIRGVQVHGEVVLQAEPGSRCALNLAGVKLEGLRRGQIVASPGAAFASQTVDARVRWVAEAKHAMRVRVAVGADDAIAHIFLNADSPDIVQLRFERPVAVALNQPIVVRRHSPPDLLCGGRVVQPQAEQRGKSKAVEFVGAASDEAAIVACLAGKSDGLETGEICRRLGKAALDLGDAFAAVKAEGSAVGFGGLWFGINEFAVATDGFLKALAGIHAANPMRPWIPAEAVCAAAGQPWRGKPLERIVASLAERGVVAASGANVRSPGHAIALTPRQRTFLDRAIEALERDAINTPNPYEIAEALGAPHQAVAEILRLGCDAGELARIGEGIYYTPRQLAAIETNLAKFAGDGGFTVAEARDALGTTRKFIVPLLERFDSLQKTVRTGEKRKIAG